MNIFAAVSDISIDEIATLTAATQKAIDKAGAKNPEDCLNIQNAVLWVVHCGATRLDEPFSADDIAEDALQRAWRIH